MDLAVNEEFTRMYSEEELMGARRIQVRRGSGSGGGGLFPSPCIPSRYDTSCRMLSFRGVTLVASGLPLFTLVLLV